MAATPPEGASLTSRRMSPTYDLPLATIECDGCGGTGFVWQVLQEGALAAERCTTARCLGQQTPVTLPKDLLDSSLCPALLALTAYGQVACAQVWERTWPRQKVWRIRVRLASGMVREARDARWLHRAAVRLLQHLALAKGVVSHG